MHRDRKPLGQMAQLRQGAAPVAHVILGVDFKPRDGGRVFQNILEMLRLIADPGTCRQGFWMNIEHRGAFHRSASHK